MVLADASVHVLLNVNFKELTKLEDREIRNYHIHVARARNFLSAKLHRLGWHHQIEIDKDIHRLYEWYLKGICINYQTV